jgi:hypothetical protein
MSLVAAFLTSLQSLFVQLRPPNLPQALATPTTIDFEAHQPPLVPSPPDKARV